MRTCSRFLGCLAASLCFLAALCLAPTTQAASRAPRVLFVIPLGHAVRPGPREARPAGVYFSRTVSFSLGALHPGERLVLCSTPDGLGPIRTDDRLVISIVSTGQPPRVLTINFGRSDGGGVIPAAPMDLAPFVRPGPVRISLSYVDLLPPARSSSAYYLVALLPRPAAAASATPTVTPTATASPSPTSIPPGRVGHHSGSPPSGKTSGKWLFRIGPWLAGLVGVFLLFRPIRRSIFDWLMQLAVSHEADSFRDHPH